MECLIRGAVPDFFSGYGFGSGYGYGFGFGSGDGYGSGYGDGSGYGYGDGYGDAFGDAFGSGSGYGDGYGSGFGYGSYWLRCIQYFAVNWTEAQQARLVQLQVLGAKIAFWRSDKDGRACQGGRNDPVKPGTVEKVKGPLELCTRNALHATLIPPKWKGDRLWVVALLGEVAGDDEKYGALEREIIGEVVQRNAPPPKSGCLRTAGRSRRR